MVQTRKGTAMTSSTQQGPAVVGAVAFVERPFDAVCRVLTASDQSSPLDPGGLMRVSACVAVAPAASLALPMRPGGVSAELRVLEVNTGAYPVTELFALTLADVDPPDEAAFALQAREALEAAAGLLEAAIAAPSIHVGVR